MVLGLLSDTHLRSADERLGRLLSGVLGPAEVLLHAGDFISEGVVAHLECADPRPFYGVAGNMDSDSVVGRLPSRRVLDLGGRRVGLVHGWGGPQGIEERLLGAFSEPLDLLVFGHTHRPSQIRIGRTLLVNPGSAFDRRFAPRCTVALVSVEPGGIEVRIEEVDA